MVDITWPCRLTWVDGSDSGYFCRLPPKLAGKVRGSSTTEVTVLRLRIERTTLYVAWNGAMTNYGTDDSIELPSCILHSQHSSGPTDEDLGTDFLEEYGDVTIETAAPRATEVEIVPSSQYDWEIANHHAGVIEESILTRMAIVVKGQELMLQITPSIAVKFTVANFKTASFSQKDFPVATLSVETTFLVAPPASLPDAVNSSSTPAAASSSSRKIPPEALIYTSLMHPLRVLPQIHRGHATNFDLSGASHSNFSSTETVLDSLEQSYQQDSGVLQPGNQDWMRYELTCIVNPHYLRGLADIIVNKQTTTDVLVQQLSLNGQFLCTLSRRAPRPTMTVQPLAQAVVVNLVLCDSIRQCHVSLPSAVRKSLGLLDFDFVNLEILDVTEEKQHRLPFRNLSMRPIIWSSSSGIIASEERGPLESDNLRSALMFLREKLCCHQQPLTLSHGSVVSLASSGGDFLIELVKSSSTETQKRGAQPTFVSIAPDDDESFLKFLEAATLGARESLNAFLPSKFPQERCHDEEPRQTLVGTGSVWSEILVEALPCLLPLAVLDRVRFDLQPQNSILIVGAQGTGKTALCKELGCQLVDNPRVVCSCEYLDCGTLVGQSMASVTDALNTSFASARCRAPSVLLIDNLDAICPAMQETAGPFNQQAAALSALVHQLLEDILAEMDDAHKVARTLFKNAGSEGREDMSHVVARALGGAVFVMATAKSTGNLNSLLQQPRLFCKAASVPSLTPEAGGIILCEAMASLRVPLQSGQLDGGVLAALEGFRPRDLHTLARRVAALVAQKAAISIDAGSLTDCLQSEYEDVIKALEDFVPMSPELCRTTRNATQQSDMTAWNSVGGFHREKTELLDIFQKPTLFRALYQQSKVRMPRAVLLYGPPGCGKTLFAQTAGAELGLAFMSVQGPQLLDKYIGASEKAVRDLFERAAGSGRPTLIFFDEFEALAPKRGRENTGVTDRVVNQLLTFLDGVEAKMGSKGGNQVYVLAATSRPDLIDVALLRPGRIEKHIYIGFPSRQDRVEILEAALSKLALAEDIPAAIQEIANQPLIASFTAADLDALAKSAYLAAVQDELEDLWGGQAESVDKKGVLVRGVHLLQAFKGSKQSLSPKDVAFYSEIYARFGGGKSKASEYPEAASAGQDHQNQRLTLM